jgi:EAL domain-containing protein (putative c-di-GMP-specific phosphodiesterase class I)/GGDEF domain-containing protein
MLSSLRSYKDSNYDSMARIDAQNLSNTITGECVSIQSYAYEIAGFEYTNVNTYQVRSYLENMVNYNGYTNISIVDKSGRGFNYLNDSVDISNEEYFSTLNVSEQVVTTVGDSLLYVTPVIDSESQFKFFILAEVPIQTVLQTITTEDWNDMGLYLLDDSDVILSSYGVDNPKEDFQSILDDNGKQYQDGDKIITSVEDINFKTFIYAIKSVVSKKDLYPIVWYEQPLDVNGWSILIGRSTINQDTDVQDLLSLSISMLAVIVVTFILVLIIFAVRNIVSNYKLKKAIFIDPLTGGTNWIKFKADASKELQKGRNRYALVSFDIYQYRLFCDINGHKKGNEALVEIDTLMRTFVRKKEYYAHNTSDTFDMLLLYENDNLLKERLKRFSERLSKSEKLHNMRFAFGVYVVDNKNISINRMSTMANMSKDNDRLRDYNLRETISFFTKEMHDDTLKEKEILNSFEGALESEQFLLFIQPKYNLLTDTLSAGEALVRWQKDDGSYINPSEFIPVFEKNGCISELDRYMLNAVCKKQRQWLDSGFNIVPISVNLSRACFSDKLLAKSIVKLVDSYKLPHNMVELEVTESAFFDNKQLLIDTVKKLRELGFSVSIDDFGAGYSSLNSLKELPIDIIKMDGGFFRDIDTNDREKSNIIVSNTIRLAYELNFKVVAEGVETDEQIAYLRSLGYDILIQSYYYSKPIPNLAFEDLLKNPVGNPNAKKVDSNTKG